MGKRSERIGEVHSVQEMKEHALERAEELVEAIKRGHVHMFLAVGISDSGYLCIGQAIADPAIQARMRFALKGLVEQFDASCEKVNELQKEGGVGGEAPLVIQ